MFEFLLFLLRVDIIDRLPEDLNESVENLLVDEVAVDDCGESFRSLPISDEHLKRVEDDPLLFMEYRVVHEVDLVV